MSPAEALRQRVGAYQAAAAQVTRDEVATLLCLIVTIKAWNAIDVSTRAWTGR